MSVTQLKCLWKEGIENTLGELIETSNEILEEKLEKTIDEKIFEDYDPDSSPIAWKYYMAMYAWLELNATYNVEIKNPRIFVSIDCEKKKAIDCKNQEEGIIDISLGGDCVFNFKEGGKTNYKKKNEELCFFDDLIEKCNDPQKKESLKHKLELCKAMQHSPYNFSLMPVEGGMNKTKKMDRPDWLFFAIKNFYSEKDKNNLILPIIEEMKIPHAIYGIKQTIIKLQGDWKFIEYRKNSINDIILFHFLLQVGSFEEYVEKFYNLSMENQGDKELLKMMEKNVGINDCDTLEQYMNMAIAYWKVQKAKYEEKNPSQK